MTTKTLTITEEAYGLLKQNKTKEESFSEGIIRILSQKRKKNLSAFFGVLTEKEGEIMQKDLEAMRLTNLTQLTERLKQ